VISNHVDDDIFRDGVDDSRSVPAVSQSVFSAVIRLLVARLQYGNNIVYRYMFIYLLNSHRRRTERTRPRKQQTAAVARQAVVAVAVVVVAVVVVEMRVGPWT